MGKELYVTSTLIQKVFGLPHLPAISISIYIDRYIYLYSSIIWIEGTSEIGRTG